MRRNTLPVRLLITVCGTFLCAATAADIEGDFRNAPDTARLWVYWTCQDGHYSIESTTADLEAMKQAGTGGVVRMDCRVVGILELVEAGAVLVGIPPAALTILGGRWEVSFDPRWGGPVKVTFDPLQGWTEHPDRGIRYYSGIPTYRRTFDYPAPRPLPLGPHPSKHPASLYLDIGTVRDLARVRLNGRDVGVTWCAPWRVRITNAVQTDRNELEIEVANRWPNRFIGDAAKPASQRATSTILRHPYNAGSRLLPSGLLGPVQITVSQQPTESRARGLG